MRNLGEENQIGRIQRMGEIKKQGKGPVFGVRHGQFVFVFFLGMMMYATRFGFSVALVAMTERYSENPDVPYYDWKNKSFILSTFFWGYVVPQIPVGILGTKFGIKKFLLAAVFMNSLFMVIIPMVAAHIGSGGVMVCRVIQGVSQGFVGPSIHNIFGKWVPAEERTRVYGLTCAGYTLGAIIGISSTGFISASWAGWPSSFYILPSFGFLWVVLYFIYGSDSPSCHKTIAKEEVDYIEKSLKSQDVRNESIPFVAIFTSIPFAAQITMSLCSGWGYNMFTTEIPIYMAKVMKYDIKSNGVMSALPHISTLVATGGVAVAADLLIARKYLSISNTRKLMSFLGSAGSAILIIIFSFLHPDCRVLSITLLVLASGVRSLNTGGYNINHIDLAPNFGGVLMGIMNTSGECFSVITPIAVQYIVYDESDRYLWRIAFLTAAGLQLFSVVVYLLFASGEIQPWNYITTPARDERKCENGGSGEEKALIT